MNPINDEIPEKESQNSNILEAKEKIETTECEELSKINNCEIQKTDETKDMHITEKTEVDSIEKENPEFLKGQSNDEDNITESGEKETLNTKELNENESNKEQSTDLEKITENTEINHLNDETFTNEQSDISKELTTKQNNSYAKECLNTKDSENSQDNKKSDEHNKQSEDNTKSEDDNTKSENDNTKSEEDNRKSKHITDPDLKEQEKENSKIKETSKTDSSIEDKQQHGQMKVNHENKELESESESEIAEEIDGEYEDVEIPEEVEELIVPDEADAEDLTSCNGDDPDKSLNEDETTKDSEAEDLALCDGDDPVKSANEEETAKEFGEVAEHETSINENENVKEKVCEEEDLTKDTEEEADINNLEPELIAIEEEVKKDGSLADDTTNDDDDGNTEDAIKNTSNDPLNCTTNQEQEEKECDNDENILSIENSEKNYDENDTNDVDGEDVEIYVNEVDDDEDEVQFVETRNSPICIESDDDDVVFNDKSDMTNNTSITTNSKTNKQTITTPTATVTVPKNIIVTRTSARKSTAKPHQVAPTKTSNSKTVPQIQNKPKNFSYLEKATYYKRSSAAKQQKVVDCIELLDSSDEESSSHYRPSSTPQLRTPQKRTLLAAKGNNNKNSNKNCNTPRGQLPTNFATQIRKQTKKPAPLPLPPATPQSNFLNAVQLQPAVSGANPPAFSALLSNKSVIIPNAFYGNPVRGKNDLELERRYGRWLENFLTQFCNPHLVVTHSCFVFLQKSLKYKDFVRIKTIRSNMNTHAQTAMEELNRNLMVDLRTILMKNNRDITTHGRRFCELTCNTTGKPVTLMAHSVSGRVTLKTCNMDIPKASTSSSAATTSTAVNSLTRKRQQEEEEDEYMPDKQKLKTIIQKPPSENGDSGETSEDRKRSLRTKRTKRLDNSFSYNEDELLAEFEIDDEEEAAEKEVQRKINQKRLEAQQQREQQVKSFESAFIQAFARSSDAPTSSSSSKNTRSAANQRIRLANSATSTATTVQKYTANNDTEDLLQATWVDIEDAQIISDDDEPKVHRIYKKQEQQQYQQFLQQQLQQQELEQQYLATPKLPTKYNTTPKFGKKYNKRHQQQQEEEIITGDDDYIENDNFFYNNTLSNVDISQFPHNIDQEMHVNGKFKDKCVICNINCQRIVHHYVNEHRGSEVYNSRLTTSQIHLLRQGNCSDSIMSMYKNGQPQYEAYCIFCQKKSRFMLPYWFQHFTMHTGEYAYRCSGCGIRKPTRSLLTQHQTQGCPEDGSTVQDYSHDAKSSKVEARVCTLCNYVQLHRGNIVKHLHQQHGIMQILPKHIQTIVLLKTPSSKSSSSSSTTMSSDISIRRRKPSLLYNQSSSSSSSSAHNTYIVDDDDPDFVMAQLEESGQSLSPTEDTQNHYYNYIPPYMQAGNSAAAANFTWQDNDPEDLSFMICGMLDVQMNTEGN